ncbi:MAG: glycosyltransferase family 9 protein [Smithella sp.]|nr:glycosyltransferase family 9 protein [Smithella sp.]
MATVLRNIDTGKETTISDYLAREIFGLSKECKSLVCLSADKIVHSKGVKNIQIFKKVKAKKIGGTCLVRMGGLGDLVILSSSIVKRKLKYPDKKITLATLPQYVPIGKNLKGVDKCISIDELCKYSFDETIDLRYSVEPSNIGPGSLPWRDYVSKDRSDNFDKLCGVNSQRKYFNIPVDKESIKKFKKMLPKSSGLVIGLNPTSKSPIRVIPPEYVNPLVNMLISRLGATVIIMGKTECWNDSLVNISHERVLNLLNKTSEADLLSLSSIPDLVITPDTGALHIAAALKKKCLGLFGNIDPRTRVTYYPTVRTIYPKRKLACIPCWDVPGSCQCEEGKQGGDCMRLITPERIFRVAKEMLQ